MIKRITLVFAIIASLAIMSCSDSKTETTLNSSQAIQGELTGVAEEVASAPGAVAMDKNMPVLDYLPFAMPVKNINETLGKIETNEKLAQVNIVRNLFPKENEASKQEDHFVFTDHLGTYTCTSITTETDSTGAVNVIDSDWISDLGGSNITIIVPANVALDGKEFRMVLNNYEDEFIDYYDEYQDYYSDYFTTLVDLDVFVSGTNVLALDFNADWEYMVAMEDVMPKYLNLTLTMTPFTLTITYSQDVNVLSYSINLKKNSITRMDFSTQITFTDATLEEVDQIAVQYTFGVYKIDFWADNDLETIMNSNDYTLQQQVDILNGGDYIWANVYKNNVIIGALQAKIVWDPKEWNEETQSYGAYVVVPYIKFTDGSEMALEDFVALFAEYSEYMGK
ncbi:MAG: hypothetical protein KKD38_01245 [Candidatus Delongbacteria bacterium]|nr:hypothetical protein [Candidatus Delongbacteria bacterium]MCG2759681.1 hypothetical protein [Candidatus Delongbacteria bacterium]